MFSFSKETSSFCSHPNHYLSVLPAFHMQVPGIQNDPSKPKVLTQA